MQTHIYIQCAEARGVGVVHLHNKAAAFVSWAFGWLTAACNEGVVMAASAARF